MICICAAQTWQGRTDWHMLLWSSVLSCSILLFWYPTRVVFYNIPTPTIHSNHWQSSLAFAPINLTRLSIRFYKCILVPILSSTTSVKIIRLSDYGERMWSKKICCAVLNTNNVLSMPIYRCRSLAYNAVGTLNGTVGKMFSLFKVRNWCYRLIPVMISFWYLWYFATLYGGFKANFQ